MGSIERKWMSLGIECEKRKRDTRAMTIRSPSPYVMYLASSGALFRTIHVGG